MIDVLSRTWPGVALPIQKPEAGAVVRSCQVARNPFLFNPQQSAWDKRLVDRFRTLIGEACDDFRSQAFAIVSAARTSGCEREWSSLDQRYSSTQASRQRFWFIPLHPPWSWSAPAPKPTSSDRGWYSSISVSSPATSDGGSYGVWPPPSVLRQQPPRE